jgi:hypothetical protein
MHACRTTLCLLLVIAVLPAAAQRTIELSEIAGDAAEPMERDLQPPDAADPQPVELEPVTQIAGEQRPDDQDLIILGNEDQVRGTLLTESLLLHTAMGPIELAVEQLAGLVAESNEPNLRSAITVNGNRISGFLDAATLRFEIAGGREIELRREDVQTLVLRQRPDELAGYGVDPVFILNNQDQVTGTLAGDGPMSLRTAFGSIDVDPADVALLEFEPGEQMLVTATAHLKDGTSVQGQLEPATFTISLGLGPELTLYQGLLAEVHLNPQEALEVRTRAGGTGEFTGTITAQSPREGNPRRNYPFEEHTFRAQRGDRFTVHMTTETFDGYLYVLSPSGQQWNNDDYQSTRASRIVQTADVDGEYRVLATTFSDNNYGDYTLSIQIEDE